MSSSVCCNENVHIVYKVLQEEMKNGVLTVPRMKEAGDGKKSRCITGVALGVTIIRVLQRTGLLISYKQPGGKL